METSNAEESSTADNSCSESKAQFRVDADFDAQYRAHVVERVLAIWSAVQSAQFLGYLEPLPQTRLHAAERAFRAVGAVQVSNLLRDALFRLTRLGAPVPLAQLVDEMSKKLPGTTDNIAELVASFAKAPGRRVVPRLSLHQPWKQRHRRC